MLSNLLKVGLQNCIQCGSFAVREALICRNCEKAVFDTAFDPIEFRSEVRGVSTVSLFQWRRDQNRILNRLALSLKGSRQKKAWDYFGERLLERWLKVERVAKSAVFVPCPSHNGEPDHAFWLAYSLSKRTGLPLRSCLERTDAKEQKRLSLSERQRQSVSKFRLKSDMSEKFSYVYFVDDIITTGSTVLAAQNVLKKVGHVKGISLLIRR